MKQGGVEGGGRVAMPATMASRVRQQEKQSSGSNSEKAHVSQSYVKVSTLDDDIARLEAELNASSSDSDSDSDSGSSDSGSEEGSMEGEGVVAVKSDTGEVVVLKSLLDGNMTFTVVYQYYTLI